MLSVSAPSVSGCCTALSTSDNPRGPKRYRPCSNPIYRCPSPSSTRTCSIPMSTRRRATAAAARLSCASAAPCSRRTPSTSTPLNRCLLVLQMSIWYSVHRFMAAAIFNDPIPGRPYKAGARYPVGKRPPHPFQHKPPENPLIRCHPANTCQCFKKRTLSPVFQRWESCSSSSSAAGRRSHRRLAPPISPS